VADAAIFLICATVDQQFFAVVVFATTKPARHAGRAIFVSRPGQRLAVPVALNLL
jgi:hypothetical protein